MRRWFHLFQDLFLTRPMGLLALLDEESLFPKARTELSTSMDSLLTTSC